MSNNKFNYTYSAPTEGEREEIDSIRRQYLPQDEREAKICRLRHLDSCVHSVPQAISLCIGVLGLLIFGFGLSLILVWDFIALGIVVALIGVPIMGFAYPVYRLVFDIYKEKHVKEILTLSEELLKN